MGGEVRNEKNALKLKILKIYSFFIALLAVLICLSIILLILSINFEKKGVNDKNYVVPIQIYKINNETNRSNIEEILKESNRIWQNYKISFEVDNIATAYVNISLDERSAIYDSNNCSTINSVIERIVGKNNYPFKVIFLSNTNARNTGRGCICNCTFLIVNSKFSTFSGWDLAHEFGHLLNAEKACWKWNLMTEAGQICEKNNLVYRLIQQISFALRKSMKPEFLNQMQVNEVVKEIEKVTGYLHFQQSKLYKIGSIKLWRKP